MRRLVAGRQRALVDITGSALRGLRCGGGYRFLGGIAFRGQGFFDAARESLKEALRIRSRPAELRQRALIERALTYLAEGKRAMAHKDFEKVLSENSAYPGLREHLANFQG